MRDPRIMIVEATLEQLPLYEYAARAEVTIFVIKQGALSALKYLHDVNYDIDAIIADLSLPDMSGFSLTKEIRAGECIRMKRIPIPIFWVTTHPFDVLDPHDTIIQAREKYRVVDVFRKPIEPVEMVRTVKTYLDEHQDSPLLGDLPE